MTAKIWNEGSERPYTRCSRKRGSHMTNWNIPTWNIVLLKKKLDFWLISFLESILVCIRVEVDPMLGYDYDITAYYEQR